MLNSRELWKPVSWALAKLHHQRFDKQKYCADKFLDMLNMEVQQFIDEQNGVEQSDDNFGIVFQG
jgi:hypothetical protein